MRRKIFIGVFLTALLGIVGIVAGEKMLNRSGAQDAPKKSEPDQKKSDGNLFDILKKDLDAKKEVAPKPETLPPLQIPPSPPVQGKDGPAPLQLPAPLVPPPDTTPGLPPLPPIAAPKDSPGIRTEPDGSKTITPPMIVNQIPVPSAVKDKPQTVEPNLDPPPPLPPGSAFPTPKPLDDGKPTALQPKDAPPPPSLDGPKQKADPLPVTPLSTKPDEPSKPPVDLTPPAPPKGPLPSTPVLPKTDSLSPMQPIVEQVAKLKNCPWSLQVDVVDGQTIVLATVNKKHEFKIVCQSLDLQTGKGTLKASGKVQISGDTMTGSCEHLAIPLMEDRLVLEGGAVVSIQKVSTNVSDTKPAAFELKGESLNLRISELPASKFQQASWQKASPDVIVGRQAVTLTPTTADKQWTPYGKLVRHETKLGPDYRLEKSNGEVITYLMAREGGSLERFVGQTISVLGATEQLHGTSVLRVTHIAFP